MYLPSIKCGVNVLINMVICDISATVNESFIFTISDGIDVTYTIFANTFTPPHLSNSKYIVNPNFY